MAESLSLFAEEISKAIAMIWGGVTIATELNYRLMTVLITSMSRIIQLLFLLTQKVTDVISIICGDILLFIGDIGMGTMAFLNLFRNFATSVISFIVAIVTGIVNSVYHSFHLISSLCSVILNLISYSQANLYSALVMFRDIIILLGSSIIFIIAFIPNLIHLLICETIYAVQNLYTSFLSTTSLLFYDSKFLFKQTLDSLINYFAGNLETLVCLVVGIIFIVMMKLSLSYVINNMTNIPRLTTPSFLVNVKRSFIRGYSQFWDEAHTEPVNNDVETVDDGSDENGNDSNQNIPDRNLERDLQVAEPVFRPINNGIQLVRRPLTRYHRRFGLQHDVSDDEIVSRRKSPSKRLGTKNLSSSFENIADNLQKQLEEERDNQLCAVCQDKKKNIILLPCRHLCLCSNCSLLILRREEPCPICRKAVTKSLRVFL